MSIEKYFTGELIPCPFCGNSYPEEMSISVEDRKISTFPTERIYRAACSCGALGPDSCSQEEAVNRWNTRASTKENRR